jgi:hypothetical protein
VFRFATRTVRAANKGKVKQSQSFSERAGRAATLFTGGAIFFLHQQSPRDAGQMSSWRK